MLLIHRQQDQRSDIPHATAAGKGSMEPNIDFELDVRIFIDSGKCILHPKDIKEDDFKK